MFFFGALHMLALVTFSSFVTDATHEDKLEFEVEVKRQGKSIEWNEKLSDTKSKEFKTFSGLVKSQIKNDLNSTLGKGGIDIKSCRQGSVYCTVEYKGDSNLNMSIKWLEEHLTNLTVEIASWKTVDIALRIVSSVKWLEVYSDPNSVEYENLTSVIEAALLKAFENTTAVFNFEIHRLSKGSDNSVIIQLQVVVDSASDLTSSDLEETVKEFTGSGAFGGMVFSGVGESDVSNTQWTGLGRGVLVLVVLAAIAVSVVIVAFVVRILFQNWKYAREHSPRAEYESYRRRKVEHETNTEDDAAGVSVGVNRPETQ